MRAANSVTSSQDFHFECVKRVINLKDFTFKPGSSQNDRFQGETGRRELSSQKGSLLFKMGELEHMQFHDKENPQRLPNFYQENKRYSVSFSIPYIGPLLSRGHQTVTIMNLNI